MPVVFVGTAIPAGAPTTNYTITIPAVQYGDLLVLACTNRDNTAFPTVVDNDVGGELWMRKTTTVANGSLWYRRATASTSGKVITASGFTASSAGILTVLRHAIKQGDPFDRHTIENNPAGNETHAGWTPGWDGCWVGIALHNTSNDNPVTAVSTTSPGALTQGGEHLGTGGQDCAAAVFGAVQSSAIPTGNFTWAQTDGITWSQAFAISPESPTGRARVDMAVAKGNPADPATWVTSRPLLSGLVMTDVRVRFAQLFAMMQILEHDPNDILVFTTEINLTTDQRTRLIELSKSMFNQGVFIENGLRLADLTPAQILARMG